MGPFRLSPVRSAGRRSRSLSELQKVAGEIAEAAGAQLNPLRPHAGLTHAPQCLAGYPADPSSFFLGENAVAGLEPNRRQRLRRQRLIRRYALAHGVLAQ